MWHYRVLSIFTVLFIACGSNSADAKPPPISEVEFHVAVVNNVVNESVAGGIWDEFTSQLKSILHYSGGDTQLNMVIDEEIADDYNTDVQGFWQGLWYSHWYDRVGTNSKYNRLVLVPPLVGGFFAGMRAPGCWRSGGGFAAVAIGSTRAKSALATKHEGAGELGASDQSGPGQLPNIMALDAGNLCAPTYTCGFNGITKQQVRECLYLRVKRALCSGMCKHPKIRMLVGFIGR